MDEITILLNSMEKNSNKSFRNKYKILFLMVGKIKLENT